MGAVVFVLATGLSVLTLLGSGPTRVTVLFYGGIVVGAATVPHGWSLRPRKPAPRAPLPR